MAPLALSTDDHWIGERNGLVIMFHPGCSGIITDRAESSGIVGIVVLIFMGPLFRTQKARPGLNVNVGVVKWNQVVGAAPLSQ
jgi:hypothetical protein